MKVVINKCYGGFGISLVALKELQKSPCKHLHTFPAVDWYAGPDAKERMDRDKKGTGLGYALLSEDDSTVITDGHDEGENRACPYLVAVIESLGKKAFGDCAELKIVEIPDGTEFEIHDYDGKESIHELHREWS